MSMLIRPLIVLWHISNRTHVLTNSKTVHFKTLFDKLSESKDFSPKMSYYTSGSTPLQ